MKKSILKAAAFVAICLCMVSCKSTYYQVYEVDTDNLKQQDNSLVYENEDCKVLYNLWSYAGQIRFAMLNKTDRDIFVNLGQSFFVKNGLAVDYYQGRTYTKQVFEQNTYVSGVASVTGTASGFWGDNIYMESTDVTAKGVSKKIVKAMAQSVTTKEEEIVCIPAKCYKVFNYYTVKPSLVRSCDKSKDFPRLSCKIASYSKESTPVAFKNRIAYGFTKSEVADRHIDNNFWISSVTNYSQKSATSKVKSKLECYGYKKTSKHREFRIGGPNKFYSIIDDLAL